MKDKTTAMGVKPKKRFGQNFLSDRNILNKIIDAAKIDKETDVIEIGPGTGNLTELLAKKAGRVVAYEIDSTLIPILKERLKSLDNITIMNKDILEIDIDKEIDEHFPDSKKIMAIANLPYYITTPILMKFLKTSDKVTRLIFMMQLEVAKRLSAGPGGKDYGALSVIMAYRTKTEIRFKVPRTVFVPAPNVDSAVVDIEIRNKPPFIVKDDSFFYDFIHKMFAYRRKTLSNNLATAYPETNKTETDSLITKANLAPGVRAEALSPEEFGRLSDIVWDALGKSKTA
ncbi:MAG TPA: 16S rRNA (adenine(1518)-N(6)/adenine(1519)-N(6))-dimethyltransferase RsmA [Bacillota bacterium]|nr:16S rRNA (adenine(1518)-N(6)/adenine(1519)-N(6))-dimethyltransferase RsmA [Bacillota bacterium]HPF42082.1 16S rRNA (adenine(1518)-N(6)/adenine(1519)-N(6))-dimethyltransferase RsmA [Bacillota bacterium]HPJ85804.1 16S rRNA (adenine(1518)-N(6)/adenine(1519)-N(6))-dimethyltransferase RsmA [Bacillota bacterium]HPQ61529.1 16S rRNA (adenine(1518)-N(6)/adenine(1519)-N(6))-dimethyltransferase RsmA [Bacillota bacterium]